MTKVIITINDGAVDVAVKPDFVSVEVRDYGVPDDFDTDNENCKFDESGDRYQEVIFPAEKTRTPIDDVEMKIKSFYKHCGEEWESVWDSACDDECPKCGKPISPYDYEDIVTDIKI